MGRTADPLQGLRVMVSTRTEVPAGGRVAPRPNQKAAAIRATILSLPQKQKQPEQHGLRGWRKARRRAASLDRSPGLVYSY